MEKVLHASAAAGELIGQAGDVVGVIKIGICHQDKIRPDRGCLVGDAAQAVVIVGDDPAIGLDFLADQVRGIRVGGAVGREGVVLILVLALRGVRQGYRDKVAVIVVRIIHKAPVARNGLDDAAIEVVFKDERIAVGHVDAVELSPIVPGGIPRMVLPLGEIGARPIQSVGAICDVERHGLIGARASIRRGNHKIGSVVGV